LANHRLVCLWELPKLAEDLHEPGTAAQMRYTPGFQRGFILDFLQSVQSIPFHFIQTIEHTALQ
jgi:hypothetical protein